MANPPSCCHLHRSVSPCLGFSVFPSWAHWPTPPTCLCGRSTQAPSASQPRWQGLPTPFFPRLCTPLVTWGGVSLSAYAHPWLQTNHKPSWHTYRRPSLGLNFNAPGELSPGWVPPTVWKSGADSYLNHSGTQPHPAPPLKAASQAGRKALESTQYLFKSPTPTPEPVLSVTSGSQLPLLGPSFPSITWD